VVAHFYSEKRFPVRIDSLPPHVVNAVVAAEDARFFSHPGMDFRCVARALLKNIQSGEYVQGASTITQQVARTLFLSKEKKLSRKIREALIAFKMEELLSKERILEIYLNEIYLGRGAYGIQAAALTYFGKPASEMTIAEVAILAGLISSPSKLSRARDLEASLKRRKLVLERMLRCGFIDTPQYHVALAEKPKLREDISNRNGMAAYFMESVRQYVAEKYGENALCNEGLQVWTTCDLYLQKSASEALLKGARDWETRHGTPPGLVKRLTPSEVSRFLRTPKHASLNEGDYVQGVVTRLYGEMHSEKPNSELQECTVVLSGGMEARTQLPAQSGYRCNDLLEFRVINPDGKRALLRHANFPSVQGAVACIENNTGFVRALIGGTDFERSPFNRAVQALRQPGSAFKPFVYAAAVERANYGPFSEVEDSPVTIKVDDPKQEWSPANSDHDFSGAMTLRHALATSRNVVAVKLLMDVGLEGTISTARRMGIESPIPESFTVALGASEVTVLELVSAYSVFPNMGMRVRPVMVKKVVDRFGRVLEDNTCPQVDVFEATAAHGKRAITDSATGLAMPSSAGADSPDHAKQPLALSKTPVSQRPAWSYMPLVLRRPGPVRALNPQTAYLMLSMMREACVSGTASAVSGLKRKDLCGKTGTTDGCTDAWFVGFSPKYTTGVWLGLDAKQSLGSEEYGAKAALPIWMYVMKHVLEKEPQGVYPVPEGIVFRGQPRHTKNSAAAELLEAGPDRSTEHDSKGSARMHGQIAWTPQYGGIALSDHQARVRDRREQRSGGDKSLEGQFAELLFLQEDSSARDKRR
jgi:penicillin-binding protein 1A